MLKKWIVGILVVGMVLVAGAAYGQFDPDGELPLITEVQVWQYNFNTNLWVLITEDAQANAKCFAKYPASGACNKKDWVIPVFINASVAQWVEWTLSGTDWEWFVRKPGKYAADCITATLKSNYDVLIDYDGFADLQYMGTGGVKTYIPVFYAQTVGAQSSPPPQADFIAADALNNADGLIVDSQMLHDGLSWKLWNYIEVEACNTACEYWDEATITLTLQGIKNWIDPLNGYFDLART